MSKMGHSSYIMHTNIYFTFVFCLLLAQWYILYVFQLPAAVITHKHHLDIKLTAFCQHEIRRNTCRMFTLQQYNFIRLYLTYIVYFSHAVIPNTNNEIASPKCYCCTVMCIHCV